MGYNYYSILVSNRIHSSSRLVWGLQAKVKCHISVGPARLDPRALNKHYPARVGPISVSAMYIT